MTQRPTHRVALTLAVVVALAVAFGVGIASGSPSPATDANVKHLIVQPGDSWFSIAQRLQPSLSGSALQLYAQSLAIANGGSFATALHPGRILAYDADAATPPITTTATTTGPSITTAPATTTPSAPGCGLTSAAFCETFDVPHNGGTQTGDLDPLLWGVSRLGDINPSPVLDGIVDSTNPCGTSPARPPSDVRVCNGQMVESVNDGHSIVNLDTYPKQPFNFAGRTGRVVFDVSADSDGSHAAWPEFVITDEPVPGVRRCISECALGDKGTPTAKNQIGFSLAGGATGDPTQTGVDQIFMSSGQTYSNVTTTQYGTVTKGSRSKMNHFEVQISASRIDVYGTEPGASALKHLAGADITLTFTQGLVWLNDVHYNARKALEPCECGTQFDHAFAWDNLGFDGPKTYRDWGTDVSYANVAAGQKTLSGAGDPQTNEGYLIGVGPRNLPLSGVSKGAATGAKVVLNVYSFNGKTVSVSVNGHAAVAHPLVATFHWLAFAIPIPLTDIVDGANTLTFTSDDGSTTVANVSLIMVAAASVP